MLVRKRPKNCALKSPKGSKRDFSLGEFLRWPFFGAPNELKAPPVCYGIKIPTVKISDKNLVAQSFFQILENEILIQNKEHGQYNNLLGEKMHYQMIICLLKSLLIFVGISTAIISGKKDIYNIGHSGQSYKVTAGNSDMNFRGLYIARYSLYWININDKKWLLLSHYLS